MCGKAKKAKDDARHAKLMRMVTGVWCSLLLCLSRGATWWRVCLSGAGVLSFVLLPTGSGRWALLTIFLYLLIYDDWRAAPIKE